jgi:hypothetical protein
MIFLRADKTLLTPHYSKTLVPEYPPVHEQAKDGVQAIGGGRVGEWVNKLVGEWEKAMGKSIHTPSDFKNDKV